MDLKKIKDMTPKWKYELEWRMTFYTLARFILNPIEGMKRLPTQWSWLHLFLIQVIVSASSGALHGILSGHFLYIFIGILFLPLSGLVCIGITGLIIHYSLQFLVKQTVRLRLLFTVLTFAAIPFYLLHTIAAFLSIIDLIGLAMAGLLTVVGLSQTCRIPRTFAIKLIGLLYFLFFVLWLSSHIQELEHAKSRSFFFSTPAE